MTIRQQWSFAALLLCAILGACTPTAEGPQDDQKNPFYLSGKERVQAMDYTGAVESFERALQQNPRSVLAHFELGLVHEQHLADYATALYHYNKAIKLRPAGYPADNIRQRIPACRQELLKADSLAVVYPSALRETEKLREENQELRRQILELKTGVAASGHAAPSGLASSGGPERSSTNRLSNANTSGGSGNVESGNSTGEKVRSYTVRPGETLASISRSQNVRLDALLAANRGLDPKRLKVGQTIKVPLR